MKKALPLTLILLGVILLIGTGIFWLESITTSEHKGLGEIILIAMGSLSGLVSTIAGMVLKKEEAKIKVEKVEGGAQVSFGDGSPNVRAETYVATQNVFQKESRVVKALSKFPNDVRPKLDITPIGREKELEKLRQLEFDGLLVGQPGSGKTFLLHQLALDGKGLFVNSENIEDIVRDYLEMRPRFLIIDDAQLSTKIIRGLLRYRLETKEPFLFLASCWPSSQDEIANLLGISENNAIILDLLTLDDLVKVVQEVGLAGPDFLINEIVHQAVGRPGLAVTLADMSLKESAKDVYFGDALLQTLSNYLKTGIGDKAWIVLSAFSVGGNAGMNVDVIAKLLMLDVAELMVIVTKLASGGLVYERSREVLAVLPPALRHVLIRDTFFGKSPGLKIERFSEHTLSAFETCFTLIGARARGGDVPTNMIVEQLKMLNHPDLWSNFAYLGRDEAICVIQNHSNPSDIAPVVLEKAPDYALPLLLQKAVGDNRELHNNPDHPLRVIDDWAKSAYPGTGIPVVNRKILLDQIDLAVSGGKAIEPSIKALKTVFSPIYQETRPHPGSGNTISWLSGTISLSEIEQLKELWPKVMDLFVRFGQNDWETMRLIVETWVYPGRGHGVNQNVADAMELFASQMLLDLLPSIKSHPGLLHWAHHLANSAGFTIEIPVDKKFEILYPGDDQIYDNDQRKNITRKQIKAVERLAKQLVKKHPKDVVYEIAQVEKEAGLAGHTWPRWTPRLCFELAKISSECSVYLDECVQNKLPDDLTGQFLAECIQTMDEGWEELALVCVKHPLYKNTAIYSIVTSIESPSDVVKNLVLKNIQNSERAIEGAFLSGAVSEAWVKLILRTSEETIKKTAIEGVWHQYKSNIPNSVFLMWKEAFLETILGDYLLNEIFSGYPELAKEWLVSIAYKSRHHHLITRLIIREKLLSVPIQFLSIDSRQELITNLEKSPYADDLVRALVGDDAQLYEIVLKNDNLKIMHLVPLCEKPSETWVKKAKLAFNFGFTSEQLADALQQFSFEHGWSGHESDKWGKWLESLEKYANDPDEKIRKAIGLAIQKAKAHQEKALKDERQDAVFGTD